jgi:hypothetical protein
MRLMAAVVPPLIRVSLVLFFLGLSESMLNLNTIVGSITTVPICCCVSFFLYGMLAPQPNLQSPYRTLFSWPLYFLMQKLQRPDTGNRTLRTNFASMSMEECQESLVMEETDERKGRDVRAIRWLIDSTPVNAEMEPLVLAIPGSFNTEWGRDVWREVSSQTRDTLEPLTVPSSAQVPLMPQPSRASRPREGVVIDTISQSVRYFFETCNSRSHFESEEARRRRMRACVEAAASLVCCLHFRLESFGEVTELISEIGRIENINELLTSGSDLSFTMRWTCLSLMTVQRMLSSGLLQGPAGFAVSGLSPNLGQSDEAALNSAQRIDKCLRAAWESAGNLYRGFKLWGREKTAEQDEHLRNFESQISALEIADGTVFDERVSLLQVEIDKSGHTSLIRQLPSASSSELKHLGVIGEIFNFTLVGLQVQALTRLSLQIRDIFEGRGTEGRIETLESLKSADKIPVPLRGSNGPMTRQLWRLQDLRDGGGLGVTVELFFLSLQQLLSATPSQEPTRVFYTETFIKITTLWTESKESLGTQNILLNIICDLVIQGRGIFSDCKYPGYITTMLLELVGDMLRGYQGPHSHIDAALSEIENLTDCMDVDLWIMARRTLAQYSAQSQGNRNPFLFSDVEDPIWEERRF